MRYCVNCGSKYDEPSSLCRECHFDQRIPEPSIDWATERPSINSPEPVFEYPGERMALVLSVATTLALVVVLGVASLGIFLGLIALSLVSLKLAHVRSQRTMIKAAASSFPSVFRLAKLAAFRLKIQPPEVYIASDPDYNAYTRGFLGHGFIVVNSAIVEDYAPAELLFVIGHEMGHMKRRHTTWLTLLESARPEGRGFIFAPLLRLIFNVWSVKAEYTADQAGLIATGDLEPARVALLKLAGGATVKKEVDLQRVDQDPQGDSELGGLAEYLGNHPFISNRVQHLVAYSASPQFVRARWWI